MNVTDGLQCFAGPFSSLWRRSAFRWPNRLIYAKVGEKDIRSLTSLISYSPFPGGIMNFNPIETRWAPGTVRPNQEITIVWHEPVAHVRREFHVGGIRLAGLRR